MALVKTGTFTATVVVKNQPAQFVPALATAIPNYTPFIISNFGRKDATQPDKIQIHHFGVEPTDGNNALTNDTVGSVAMYVCSVSAPYGGGGLCALPIVPLNSANGALEGLSAFSENVYGITTKTIVSSLNVSPAPFSPAGLTVAHMYGPMGLFKTNATFPVSGIEPLGINNAEAFQINKPLTGTTDSVLVVTVTVRTIAGAVYLIEGISGGGSDILTIFNNTGARLQILDVKIVDWYRFTSVNQRYDVLKVKTGTRVDSIARLATFDSTKPLPNWVEVGSGFFYKEGPDIWTDVQEIVHAKLTVSANVYPGAIHQRSNRPLQTGKDIDLALLAGESLVFSVPTYSVMSSGQHDIRVTFSTYSEAVSVGSSAEYSYAY